MHADLELLLRDTAAIARPPDRVSVPAAAERHVRTRDGAWSNELTYYMVQPAECLGSREFEGVAFCGPARTGKTQALMDNSVAHRVVYDPVNMLLIFPTADLAQKFSEQRIDKMHQHSPDIRSRLARDQNADNIFRKKYQSGMHANLVSPTKNSLAGLEYEFVALVDYDRFADDIGGDGDAWKLASKRTATFLSRGMTVAESSPSKPISDAKFRPDSAHPHEAPPSAGILGIFNRGDRRRLYTRCQHCGEFWMPAPDIAAFDIPGEADDPIEDRAAEAGVTCARCGSVNGPALERVVKRGGVWLKEGETIDANERIEGEARRSRIASFWMPGVFAAFQSWRSIVREYLTALEVYERTGDETALKSTINVDQGAPYLERGRQQSLEVETLMARAEVLRQATVPPGVRFLTAAIDTQHASFPVQVLGIGEGQQRWVIDRFSLSVSERLDGDGRPVAIAPASFAEDWNLLLPEVIEKTYPLADGSGRRMQIARTVCDLHGEAGVSERAYQFARRMRSHPMGRRFRLVRGGNVQKAPRFKEREHEDDKDRRLGKVEYLELNVDRLKDMVFGALLRTEPGPGYIHFAEWLPESWYDELLAEVKDAKGRYQKIARRNETLDLLVYGIAASLHLGVETIDWANPATLAKPWDENPLVMDADASGRARPIAQPAKRPRRNDWVQRRRSNRRR